MLRKAEIKTGKKKGKGQSTVEYILLFTAVVAVVMLFLRPNGIFYTALNQTLVDGTNSMLNMANRLKNSLPLTP